MLPWAPGPGWVSSLETKDTRRFEAEFMAALGFALGWISVAELHAAGGGVWFCWQLTAGHLVLAMVTLDQWVRKGWEREMLHPGNPFLVPTVLMPCRKGLQGLFFTVCDPIPTATFV